MNPRVVWVGIILTLLLGSVAIQVVLLVAALNDPSFAVEPDYERKAHEWDEHQVQQTRNKALGWTFDVGTTPTGVTGERELWVELYDTWGKPIMDAQMGIETFHNARAGHVLATPLAHQRDARYVAKLQMARPGIWELRLRVQRGEDVFTAPRRKSLARLVTAESGG